MSSYIVSMSVFVQRNTRQVYVYSYRKKVGESIYK